MRKRSKDDIIEGGVGCDKGCWYCCQEITITENKLIHNLSEKERKLKLVQDGYQKYEHAWGTPKYGIYISIKNPVVLALKVWNLAASDSAEYSCLGKLSKNKTKCL